MAIPLFEMKLSKAPIVILKGGDRQLTFYKAKKFASKYFAIKEGTSGMVFELDDRYEYRYKNTSVYIYNFSNFKPISLSGLAEIDKKLRTDGRSQLENIDAMLNELTEEQLKGIKDVVKDPKKGFSPETKRFLEDYSTDDENSKTEMLIALNNHKSPIPYYSSPLMGMGMNSGHYAVVQIGHKKLDIVPMHLYQNRAYTEYGVFNFTVDNLYLVKKQMMAFFILNETEDTISDPVPRPVARQIKTLARKKRWSYLESFNKPKRTKMKNPQFAYQVRIDQVPVNEDEDVKAKINSVIRPKPIPTTQKKAKKIDKLEEDDNSDIDAKILAKIASDNPPMVEETIDDDGMGEQTFEEETYTDEPTMEEEPLEVINDEPIQEEPIIEEDNIELDIADATGPPSDK